MFKSIALIALLCLPTAYAETKFNVSGDAYVRGYFKNSTGPYGTSAFNQFFRVNVDAKADEHVTLKTGLVLSGNTWEGDTHSTDAIGGTHEDGFGKGDTTRLDHAVIEYSNDGWITSAGRHAVSSPGNFLTSDDRRDRVQVLKVFPSYDLLALVYDKRSEGTLANSKDDLDMFSANYYGSIGQFKYALQSGFWYSKSPTAFSLDNIKQLTPQLTTKFAGIDLELYYTILWGGSTLYKKDHHSFAVKLAKDLEVVKVEYQTILTRNGGLVAGGFDSLSSIVNNSPDHNQSSIKLKTIGFAGGVSGANEYLHMLRFTKIIFTDLTATFGLGCGKIYTPITTPTEKVTILDTTFKYSLSKALALNLKYGKFLGDNKDHAGSLSLNALF